MFIDKQVFLHISKNVQKVPLSAKDQTSVKTANKFIRQNQITEKLSAAVFVDIKKQFIS